MDANFNEIFNRYLDNRTSVEEDTEVMGMIREGSHRDKMEWFMNSLLKDDPEHHLTLCERDQIRKKIFTQIKPAAHAASMHTVWMAEAVCFVLFSLVFSWIYESRPSESLETLIDVVTSALSLTYSPDKYGNVVIDGKGCS
jgi:hypothetical protein